MLGYRKKRRALLEGFLNGYKNNFYAKFAWLFGFFALKDSSILGRRLTTFSAFIGFWIPLYRQIDNENPMKDIMKTAESESDNHVCPAITFLLALLTSAFWLQILWFWAVPLSNTLDLFYCAVLLWKALVEGSNAAV